MPDSTFVGAVCSMQKEGEGGMMMRRNTKIIVTTQRYDALSATLQQAFPAGKTTYELAIAHPDIPLDDILSWLKAEHRVRRRRWPDDKYYMFPGTVRVQRILWGILNLVLLPWEIAFSLILFLWIAIYFSGDLGDGQNFTWFFQNVGLYPHQTYFGLMAIFLLGAVLVCLDIIFMGLISVDKVVAKNVAKPPVGLWFRNHPSTPMVLMMILTLMIGGLFAMIEGKSGGTPVVSPSAYERPGPPVINRVLLDMNGHMVSGNAKIVQISKTVYQVRMAHSP